MTESSSSDIDARKKRAEAEHRRVSDLLSEAEEGDAGSLVWVPTPHVALGRRDVAGDRYDRARAIAREHGYSTAVRNVGGNAVVHDGSTVSFATAFRVDEPRARISERYEETLDALEGALLRLPNDHDRPAEEERVRDVEAPGSFCPGKNALGYNDDGTERKYAGVAQRVTQEAALVSGVVVVESGDEIRRVLSDIYSALGVDFEPETVGGLDDAGFGVSVSRVARGLREALEDEAGGDAGVGRA